MPHVALSFALLQLIGTAQVPGDASDGFAADPPVLEDGTPHDRFGAFGSAISYTGIDNLYLATPDRGPADGATTWNDRAYVLDVRVDPGAAEPLRIELVDAIPLVHEDGQPFIGSIAGFDASGSPSSARLDPEGVRVSSRGTFFVSDEYGPYLVEMDAWGQRLRVLPVPDAFLIAQPAAVAEAELPPGNLSGRQANRGMEGLAISPDGTRLYGIMQSPLIQDHGLDAQNKRKGVYIRILEVDLTTLATYEYVYTLDKAKHGVNEILAVDDHRLLVLERDGDGGTSAGFKRVFLIDLDGATDVSAVASLPQTGALPAGVVAVTKTPFLDLLDPAFGLVGAGFPEKIEGLTWAPDLADGRHVLLVSVDNDLVATTPSTVWAFAVDPAALSGLERQQLSPVVDVQPGDPHDRVWPRWPFPVGVGILSAGFLDATAIDPASVVLGEAPVVRVFGVPVCLPWDLNHDGAADLYCLVDGPKLGLPPGPGVAALVAATTTGTPVRSSAPIWVK